jgi:STE24 endopeptidase
MAPLVVDPVFNNIDPMPSTPLQARIEELAKASGLQYTPVFVCDRHRQTNEINAYVTGLGSSSRIVLWDTTLRKLPEDEILCVVSHELGHYVLMHVYKGCGIAVLVSLLLVPVNVFVTPELFKKAPSSWQISSIGDIAGVPLFLLCISVIGFVSEPIVNGYSRGVEHEADMFGLKVFKDRQAFARTFAALSRDNLAEPDPPELIELWSYSHPTLGKRIKSALTE